MDIFGKKQNEGTVSFEEIEGMFRTPTQRQDDYERPEQPQAGELPTSLTNPGGEDLQGDLTADIDLSPERAQRTGERIARLIDTGIDFTLSNFVAHNNETYRADEKDLQDIAECWGEISKEHGWSLGPEWSLVILYVMVYGPIVKQAITDRRLAEIEQRLTALENQKKTEKEPKPNTDGTPDPTPAPNPFTHQQGQD